jgi:hypothetical protein
LPGVISHHQHDDVQVEGVPYVHGGHQVTNMRRIEGAAEQTDAQTGGRGHPCSLETNIYKGNKILKSFY